MILRALLVAAMLIAASSLASALELEVAQRGSRSVIVARGELAERDGQRLTGLIARTGRVDEIWLDSVAGARIEGQRFGATIRQVGLTTRVPRGAKCAAACVDALLGGLQRIVEEDRAVGLDMPDAARIAPIRGRVETALRRGGEAGLGEAVRLLDSVEAQTTSEWARYVAAMGLPLRIVERALPLRADRIEWLLRSDLRSIGLATGFD
jgi:hypothetical protein